jgi:hypothetical protein
MQASKSKAGIHVFSSRGWRCVTYKWQIPLNGYSHNFLLMNCLAINLFFSRNKVPVVAGVSGVYLKKKKGISFG